MACSLSRPNFLPMPCNRASPMLLTREKNTHKPGCSVPHLPLLAGAAATIQPTCASDNRLTNRVRGNQGYLEPESNALASPAHLRSGTRLGESEEKAEGRGAKKSQDRG